MFDLQAQRDMNRGFGDGLTRAVELALTPLVFGLIGYGIDRLAGTSPIFAVVLAAFGLLGMVARFWYGYDQEMRTHESAGSWNRDRAEHPGQTSLDLWGDAEEVA